MARQRRQPATFGIQHHQPHCACCWRVEVLSDPRPQEGDLGKHSASPAVAALGGTEVRRRTRDAPHGPVVVGGAARTRGLGNQGCTRSSGSERRVGSILTDIPPYLWATRVVVYGAY